MPIRHVDPSSAGKERAPAAAKNWSSKFYCTTEEGDLIYADWIAEKANDDKRKFWDVDLISKPWLKSQFLNSNFSCGICFECALGNCQWPSKITILSWYHIECRLLEFPYLERENTCKPACSLFEFIVHHICISCRRVRYFLPPQLLHTFSVDDGVPLDQECFI